MQSEDTSSSSHQERVQVRDFALEETNLRKNSGASANPMGGRFGTSFPPVNPHNPEQEGRQASPEEMSGPALDDVVRSPTTAAIMRMIPREHDDPEVRPMGFTNGVAPAFAASVCYRNAAMTMLLNLPFFSNWVMRDFFSMAPDGFTDCIIYTLWLLATQYWQREIAVDDTSSPGEASRAKQETLDRCMDRFWKQFLASNPNFTPEPEDPNLYSQEDAALFLTTLLGSAFEELGPDSTDGGVLQHMFTPLLINSSYCFGGCQKTSLDQAGWIHMVSFENPLVKKGGERNFQECFDASLKQRQEWYCSECRRQTTRTVVQRFRALPEILLTQLNRSTIDEGKIQHHCEIPEELTIPLHESAPPAWENHKYSLAAVVAHSGRSSKGGHYISYVRDPAREGGWIEIDDDKVRNIGFEEINRNRRKGMKHMLPYIMAWDLIKVVADNTQQGHGTEVTNREENQRLDRREEALDRLGTKLFGKEEGLRLRETQQDKTETWLAEERKKLTESERALQTWVQELDKKEKELDGRERALQEGGATGGKSKQDVQVGSEEVDGGKDVATFCATFRNSDNYDENARAIFRLNNFRPDVFTKIGATLELCDAEGNLRPIKKGTNVSDKFTIIFTIKGGKKRKRGGGGGGGGDDENQSAPPPPAKKSKRTAKRAGQPHDPPEISEEPRSSRRLRRNPPAREEAEPNPETRTSPKIKNESESPKLARFPAKASPPPPPPPPPPLRRSARVNKGKRFKTN